MSRGGGGGTASTASTASSSEMLSPNAQLLVVRFDAPNLVRLPAIKRVVAVNVMRVEGALAVEAWPSRDRREIFVYSCFQQGAPREELATTATVLVVYV